MANSGEKTNFLIFAASAGVTIVALSLSEVFVLLPSLTPTGSFIRCALRCRMLPRGIFAVYLLTSPDGLRFDLFLMALSRRTFDIAHLPDVSRDRTLAQSIFRAVVRGRVTPYGADEVIDTLLAFPDKI